MQSERIPKNFTSRKNKKAVKNENYYETLKFILIMLGLSVLVSFNKSGSTNPKIEPFSNGTNERNMIVVISDIHLGADLAYAEINDNLKALESFLKKVRVAPNIKELVIAGDLFDEWYVPATINTYQGKDQSDFVQRIATANKGVISALNKIIQEKNKSYLCTW